MICLIHNGAKYSVSWERSMWLSATFATFTQRKGLCVKLPFSHFQGIFSIKVSLINCLVLMKKCNDVKIENEAALQCEI